MRSDWRELRRSGVVEVLQGLRVSLALFRRPALLPHGARTFRAPPASRRWALVHRLPRGRDSHLQFFGVARNDNRSGARQRLFVALIHLRYDKNFFPDLRQGFRLDKNDQPLGEIGLRKLIAKRRQR
jgi:hypothetical protein